MAKIMELNSLIHGQFESEAQFATALGWSRQRMNKITTGKKQPTLEEVQQLAEGLRVPFMMVCGFFLKKKSPNE